MSIFGPAYEPEQDADRIEHQRERILAYMLRSEWRTLAKIRHDLEHRYETNVPEASISAQLRHLRKKAFGGYRVEKRRSGPKKKGLWEYRVRPPEPQELQPALFKDHVGGLNC